MLITRASAQLLGTRRIDPGYYAPVHVADEQRLQKFGAFELGECGRFFVGPFGSELPSSLYRQAGIPLLRVGNVGQLDMNEENLAFLDEVIHNTLAASEALPGDLLIVKASVGEKICRFPSRFHRGNITQHIIGIRPNGYADMDYVAVALFSPIGRRQLKRRSLGSIIQYLGVVDARTVLIPRVAPDAQRYIGNKIRQAEQLRERARKLERDAAVFFAFGEWTRPRAGTRRAYRAKGVEMRMDRLDAPFYDPGHFDLENLLRQQGGIEIGSIAVPVETRWDKKDHTINYIEIGDVDVGSGAVRSSILGRSSAPASAQTVVGIYDVLVATVRPNRKNVGLVTSVNGFAPTVASGAFSALRFRSPESAAFYHAFLRSDAATQQLVRWNSGSTYPTIDPEVATAILVPKYEESVVQNKGRHWLRKFYALEAAQRLVDASRLLVGHLVDKHTTEAVLVDAQQGLDAGDRSADRDILKSLRDGTDAEPLIADLDALYALLDEPGESYP